MLAYRRFALILTAGLLLAMALGAGVRAQAPPPDLPPDVRRASSAGAERLALYLQGLAGAPSPAAGGGTTTGGGIASGGDIVVNNAALDTPDFTTQSETTLAVAGAIVCAGYNDSGAGGYSGFSRSANRGVTWTDNGGIGQFGDPVLAVHRASGTFYYAEIATIGGVSAIGVAKSTDGCQTFPTLANASPSSTAAAHMQDKAWIAVDNTAGANNGNVYVCWTRFPNNFPGPPTSDEIRFSRSIDGGATFINDQVISPGTDVYPFGCSVDVGPSGEVYVAWSDRGAGTPTRIRRSLDGGVTFPAAAVKVNTNPNRHPGIDRIITCDIIRTTLLGDIRTLPGAWMAVDTTGGPFNGNIYVVWQSDPVGAVDNSDVYFSRSSNGGLTWTLEAQIGGGTVTDQFEPFVKVGGAGTVAIAWLDRRNDPVNNLGIDLYTTFSRDGGATFDPIVRITDASFPVPPILGQPTGSGNFDPGINSCYMGEYVAMATGDNSFYYAWGDNRNTVVSANYPAGRPDPDVFVHARLVPALPGPVGGIAKLSGISGAPLEARRPAGPAAGTLAGLAAVVVVAAVTLIGAARYVRRGRLA